MVKEIRFCKFKRLVVWTKGNSVPERAFSGTEYARGAKNRLLWYGTHFQGHSVRRTGFCGTEEIFGTGNALLRYGVHLHSEALGTGNALLWYGVHLQRAGCLASPHVVPQKKNRPLDSLAGRFYAQYFIKPANGIKVSSDIRKKGKPANGMKPKIA